MNTLHIRSVFCIKDTGCWLAITFLVFGMSNLPVSCAGQGESIVYTNLAVYLTNRTWIKELEVDLSRNRDKPSNADNRPSTDNFYRGFTTWKTSLQPDGFFLQCVSNSAFSFVPVFGESTTQYWQITHIIGQKAPTEVDTVSKNRAEGGSDENAPIGKQVLVRSYKEDMLAVLNLGIKGLDNNHITWISDKQFTSPFLDWVGHPTPGKVNVTIESIDNGLPQRLRCVLTDGKDELDCLILCRYEQFVLPPSEVIIQRSLNGMPISTLTNIIRKVVFGLRDNALSGFTPSDFLTKTDINLQFVVQSNGVRYIVQKDGRRQAIDEAAAIAALDANIQMARRAAPFSPVLLIRAVFLILLILPIVVVLYNIWQKKKR